MRVIIVGSGLLGLTTAYFLSRCDVDACVVDRQVSAGLETSYANGGMLHASQAQPWNSPGILRAAVAMFGREDSPLLFRLRAMPKLLTWGIDFLRHSNPQRYARNTARNIRLARYSLTVMGALRASEGLAYDCNTAGTMTIFRSQSEFDSAADMITRADPELRAHILDKAQMQQREPALEAVIDRLAGGIYYPDDESGDALKFCRELQAVCQQRGVEFRFNTQVIGLERDHSGITNVQTSTGPLRGDAYVVAAGSYSPLLTRTIGLNVAVQPVKGYSLSVPVGDWHHEPRIPIIDDALHAAVCPLDAQLRVAGTAEFTGYDTVLTPARVENLYKLLLSIYPSFRPHLDRDACQAWTGLRPVTADGVGIMGRSPIANLFLNTGHGHLGWTMAAGAGKAVAMEIVGRDQEFSLADYRLP